MCISVAIDARLVGTQAGGDATYWTNLINALDPLEEIQLYLFVLPNTDVSSLKLARSKVVRLSSANSRTWSYYSFPIAARKLGAQVVHTQYSLSPLVQKGGVTTIHDVSFLIQPQWFPFKDRWMLRLSVPTSARRASKVITVSETSKEEIVKHLGLPAQKIAVTYNAGNEQLFPIPKEEARSILGSMAPSGPFALSVSTLAPRKNTQLAIRAIDALGGDLQLLLTGKKGWGSLPESPWCQQTGYVSEEKLRALYSLATLYICPSLHEGFGIPVVEAFQCGCPVLCGMGGALPEVVGNAAVIVPTWKTEDWSAAIRSLTANPGKLAAMQQAGLERAKAFSWKRTAEQTRDVYLEVACP